MAILPVIALTALAFQAQEVTLESRIDLYDPETGAYVGSETTFFSVDGRRLREQTLDAEGAPELLFFVVHDSDGREIGALFYEGEGSEPWRETFTYSEDGRVVTTTYFPEPGTPGERTESDRDEVGREVRKRYFRTDGSLYGREDVLWNDDGTKLGWDFRYIEREGGASFRYEYLEAAGGVWVRRVRSRDGVPERIEVQTRVTGPLGQPFPNPVPFARGVVSTRESETSPSFTADGRTMVFARYGDDWYSKSPYIAYLEEDGWRVEAVPELGTVYNVAISPDGYALFFATNSEADDRKLFRVERLGDGWSSPENLTERYGLVGTYANLTEEGDLILFDATGAAGSGVYFAPRKGDGFGPASLLFAGGAEAEFDAFARSSEGPLVMTRCFDGMCASGPENGFWVAHLDGREPQKIPALPYGWGASPVESLGLFVFTDGDDILALPLADSVVRARR